MITVSNVSKSYHEGAATITALRDIHLQIKPGEIFGIIGQSGAGKSTLLRCLNLLERPDQGSVNIGGTELTTLSAGELRQARKQIGMIFQHFNLLSSRTVEENIAFPLEVSGWTPAEIRREVDRLLPLVGLEDRRTHYPAQLSGGQKQRVGIARALATSPKVLLCDEATSALDPETTHSILGLLKEINQTLGLTIVLITHEMSVVKEICHRVAVMSDGRIVESESVLSIFSAPTHPVTQRFVKSVTSLDLPDFLTHLPISDTASPDSSLLVRLTFIGDNAKQPVLSRLIRRLDLDATILQGTLDSLQGTPFGHLLVELRASESVLESAVSELEKHQVNVEVIGYVARNYRTAI
ncbi:methionine ABC transporter ATP-binding protein [Azotosporobacter soli]|uniref:methionine ABC transporter ATP-binding protein n=1 Tax=Azotosporobacter soli TaxID=3055040 RepID=UPI0031FF38AF